MKNHIITSSGTEGLSLLVFGIGIIGLCLPILGAINWLRSRSSTAKTEPEKLDRICGLLYKQRNTITSAALLFMPITVRRLVYVKTSEGKKKQFDVNKSQFDALFNERPYCVYYSPVTKKIVSVEMRNVMSDAALPAKKQTQY